MTRVSVSWTSYGDSSLAARLPVDLVEYADGEEQEYGRCRVEIEVAVGGTNGYSPA
jgi:hypothetical protein